MMRSAPPPASSTNPATSLVSAIRAARHRRGLTLAKLAQLSGLNLSQISQIENGRVDVRLSSLEALANALDLVLVVTGRDAIPAAVAEASAQTVAAAPAAATVAAPASQPVTQAVTQAVNPAVTQAANQAADAREPLSIVDHLRLPTQTA